MIWRSLALGCWTAGNAHRELYNFMVAGRRRHIPKEHKELTLRWAQNGATRQHIHQLTGITPRVQTRSRTILSRFGSIVKKLLVCGRPRQLDRMDIYVYIFQVRQSDGFTY